MSSTRSLKKISSLVKLRSRHETPYESWEEEEVDSSSRVVAATDTDTRVVVEFPEMSAAASPEPLPLDEQCRIPSASCSLGEGESLVECFYIGSMDMVGLSIRGRGCIDTPAARIWEHTQQQEERKLKRKNSWPMKYQHNSKTARHTLPASTAASNSFKPRYVKLVTGSDALMVHDNATNQLITQFSYRKISFVGTHPKYSRLFAFIAGSAATSYCHAFKCEDKDCAQQAACNLSDLFSKKIKQLQTAKIQVTAEATVLPLT